MLDPNEVYREDYEEDVIQNQDLKTGFNDGSYNNQYQTPYYNYQEDYFNEEDEYKYLEEEREEAASLEHKKQLHVDHHLQEVRLVTLDLFLENALIRIYVAATTEQTGWMWGAGDSRR